MGNYHMVLSRSQQSHSHGLHREAWMLIKTIGTIAAVIIVFFVLMTYGSIMYNQQSVTMAAKIIKGDLPQCDPTLKASEGYEEYCLIGNTSMWCKVEPQVDEHLKNTPMCQPVVFQ